MKSMLEPLRNWPKGELASLPRGVLRAFLMPEPDEDFTQLRSYCVFLGHSRSGHSLMASLLDAHRNIVMADEIRSLKYIAAGLPMHQVYKLVLQNSRDIAGQSRSRAGYGFEVAGGWQGRYENLQVLGDKDGSWTATMARRNFTVIEALFRRVPVDVRILHLYRNPYDVISTIYRRYVKAGREGPLQHAIDFYFNRTEGIERVRRFAPADSLLELRHEDVVDDPTTALQQVCMFLGIGADADYLRASQAIIYEKPRVTRHDIVWDEAAIAEVQKRAVAYDYLDGYRFHETP